MKHIDFENKRIRIIDSREITNVTRDLFISINHNLSDDVIDALNSSKETETVPIAKNVLCRLCQNLDAAKELGVPICQDTGMAVVFVELGSDVLLMGDTLETAINKGVKEAYVEGLMRLSIVRDPLYDRKNTNDNTPAIIHIRSVEGNKIKITAAPKGFGSENMSTLKMFTPSATEEDIINFIVNWVGKCGSNPCPPIIVGVGIGGNFEHCAYLAKYALTRPLSDKNPNAAYSQLEKKILERVNKLNIGPQGFGGNTTALAVKVEYAPTHIAGLPVAVNINCHVARHISATI